MDRGFAARGITALALLAAALGPAPALAQGDVLPKAVAEGLFRDARRLLGEGKLDEACPKFVAAQKLDPTVGTALNIGECFERAGKTASAWAGFEEARRLARQHGDAAREAEADRRAGQLAPRLSRLTITTQGTVPPGAVLLVDEEALDLAVIGTPIPIDPGRHVITLDSPGATWRASVIISPERPSAAVTLAPPAHVAPPPPRPPLPDPPPPFWGRLRIAGAAVGAAGVVGVVVGSVFGATAISRKNTSNDGPCDSTDHCDATGKALRAEGLRAGNVSTAAFVAGGVALLGGVTLFVLAPPRVGGPRPALAVGPGRVSLTAEW